MDRLVKDDVAHIKILTQKDETIPLTLSIWKNDDVRVYFYIRQTVIPKLFIDRDENEWWEDEIYDNFREDFQSEVEATKYIEDSLAANVWDGDPLI